MLDLSTRELIGELMDDPALPEDEHRHALRGLARINRISATSIQLGRAIRRQVGTAETSPLSILDIASGGGDVTLGLARYAKRRGLPWQITGCDISPTAVQIATAAATAHGLEAQFIVADALAEQSQAMLERYDIVTCTLFLHHLTDEQIVTLLRQAGHARHVVISDLHRTVVAYAATWLGTRLLSTSPIVHVDGPLSVRAALTSSELTDLAEKAGLKGCNVTRHFPMRMMLRWTDAQRAASDGRNGRG